MSETKWLEKGSYWRIKTLGESDKEDKPDDAETTLKTFIFRAEKAMIVDEETIADAQSNPKNAEGLIIGYMHGVFSVWNDEKLRAANIAIYQMGINAYPLFFLFSSLLEPVDKVEAELAHAKAKAEYAKEHDEELPDDVVEIRDKSEGDCDGNCKGDCSGCSSCGGDKPTMPGGNV